MDITQIKQQMTNFITDGKSEDFPQMALTLFNFQFNHNLDYQKFCIAQGKTPQTVRQWQDIPAVPIDAFKQATFSAIPPEDAAYVFMTSGTTRGIKGKNYHLDLDVYDLAMTKFFKQKVMPQIERIDMGILFPSPNDMPHSSLAHYLEVVEQQFGTSLSDTFINQQGIQFESVVQSLRHAEAQGTPYALLGASYSLVHFLDYLADHGLYFKLPKDSFIFDTGGYKNQSRDVPQSEFYSTLEKRFGVPKDKCINMYGVTELSTQFYDDGNAVSPSIKHGPHWCRSRIVNPLTLEPVPNGEKGVLIHYDLANYNSVAAIMMEDIGEARNDGFILHGRTEGALAKGCSLAVESFLNTMK